MVMAEARALLRAYSAVETNVARLLDRAEFRAHCDRWKTRSAILANLR